MPTETIAVLPQARRQGTFQTSSYNVPVGATGTIVVRPTMSLTDAKDPTNSLSCHLFASSDNGATYQHVAGFDWVGGDWVSPPGKPPYDGPTLMVALDYIAGKRVRFELDIPNPFRIGGELTIETP